MSKKRITLDWQAETQLRLDAAGAIAARRNKSITVVVAEGEYSFTNLLIPPHVSLVADPATTRSVRLRYVGDGDETLFTFQGEKGYGSRLAGFTVDAWQPRLTGIKVENAINPVIEDCRINLLGEDSIGLHVAGRESLTTNRLELRASVPIRIDWADNCAFRDCDLGASGRVKDLPNCVVHLNGPPSQITFDGSQTWQGGDHAIFGERDGVLTKGQNLNLYNVRWEQSTSRDDVTKAAIHLRFTPRGFENLVMIGCRWTDRVRGFNLAGVDGITLLGSRLPGSR
jgi:hypothetical protein